MYTRCIWSWLLRMPTRQKIEQAAVRAESCRHRGRKTLKKKLFQGRRPVFGKPAKFLGILSLKQGLHAVLKIVDIPTKGIYVRTAASARVDAAPDSTKGRLHIPVGSESWFQGKLKVQTRRMILVIPVGISRTILKNADGVPPILGWTARSVPVSVCPKSAGIKYPHLTHMHSSDTPDFRVILRSI